MRNERKTVVVTFKEGDIVILRALKARDQGEPYQLRWHKNEKICCVPSCGSADINVHRHDISCGDVCNSISLASVSVPVDRLLHSKHY